MRYLRAITVIVMLSLLLLASCSPTGQAIDTAKSQAVRSAPAQQAQPVLPGGVQQVEPAKTLPAQAQDEKPSSPPLQQADGQLPTDMGYNILKLAPVGDATDDEIVRAMSLLQVELGVKPELKVKQVSRSGTGKNSIISVATELSSTKPIIAVINAISNRERFEGKIGDKILFNNNDLRFVCRLPVCAAVEDMSECPAVAGGHSCAWTFGIVIWESAGQRVADAAKELPTRLDGNELVIDTPINLYLNGKLLDYVYIPANMTNAPITDMSITGNATAPSQKEAQKKAAADMDRVRNTMSRKLLPIELKIIDDFE